MSWMIEFTGSLGSNSPKARPASVSYCPALPNVAPLKAGEVFVSITNRTTRAEAGTANVAARSTTSASTLRTCMNPPHKIILCFATSQFHKKIKCKASEIQLVGNEEKASPIHNLCQGSYAETDPLPNCFQSELKK